MAGGSITGVVGKVQCAYAVAAALNGYTVTRSETGAWSLHGQVVLSNTFNLTLRPLTFVAPHDKGEWRWPIRDCHIAQGVLTAQLGPPEGSK